MELMKIIILLIWIISLFTGDSTKLTGLTDATEAQTISGDSLPSDNSSNN